MIVDQQHALAAESEQRRHRLAAVVESGIGRRDAPGVERQRQPAVGVGGHRRCGGGVASAVAALDQGHAARVIEIGDADIAARLTAVGQRFGGHFGIVVARPAGIDDRIRQPRQGLVAVDHEIGGRTALGNGAAGRAVVVLDFLQGHDVRRTEALDDLCRDRLELAVGHVGIAIVVVGVEILDVVAGHAQRVAAGQHADIAARQRGRLRLDQGVGQDLEIAETVAENADHLAEQRAGIHGRHRVVEQRVVDLDTLGVVVDAFAALDQGDAAAGIDAGCVRAGVRHEKYLAEIAGRADGHALGDAHAHGLEAFIEIEAVLGRVEDRAGVVGHVAVGVVVDDRVRRRAAALADGHRRDLGGVEYRARVGDQARAAVAAGHDFGGRQVGFVAAGIELRDGAGHFDHVAHSHRRAVEARWRAAGEYEHRIAGGVLAIAGRILKIEAVAGHGGHHAGHAGHGVASLWRNMRGALDIVDPQPGDGIVGYAVIVARRAGPAATAVFGVRRGRRGHESGGVAARAAAIGHALQGFVVLVAVGGLVELRRALGEQNRQFGIVAVAGAIDHGIDEIVGRHRGTAGEIVRVAHIERNRVLPVLQAVAAEGRGHARHPGIAEQVVTVVGCHRAIEIEGRVAFVVAAVVEDQHEAIQRGIARPAVAEFDELGAIGAGRIGIQFVDENRRLRMGAGRETGKKRRGQQAKRARRLERASHGIPRACSDSLTLPAPHDRLRSPASPDDDSANTGLASVGPSAAGGLFRLGRGGCAVEQRGQAFAVEIILALAQREQPRREQPGLGHAHQVGVGLQRQQVGGIALG